MNPDEFKAAISSVVFRSELHHLLWIDPSVNRGDRDLGWSCREHALFVGMLAALQGFGAVFIHGRAQYIQGKVGDCSPGGVTQEPHSWVRIDGLGSFDLSVRLNTMPSKVKWEGWENSFLVGGKFKPDESTTFASVSEIAKFKLLCATATYEVDRRSAIYLQERGEQLGREQVENARKWCNSPLTEQLKRWHPTRSDIYAKAILHLDEILNGSGHSLTGQPQMSAWGQIGKRPGNGRLELVNRLLG